MGQGRGEGNGLCRLHPTELPIGLLQDSWRSHSVSVVVVVVERDQTFGKLGVVGAWCFSTISRHENRGREGEGEVLCRREVVSQHITAVWGFHLQHRNKKSSTCKPQLYVFNHITLIIHHRLCHLFPREPAPRVSVKLFSLLCKSSMANDMDQPHCSSPADA